MEAAVAQLAVIDIRLLVPFPGLLLDPGDFLALRLGLLDLVLDDRNNVLVDSQVVVQILGDEVIDVRADGRPAVDLDGAVGVENLLAVPVGLLLLPHVGGSELGLCLAFEVRLLDLDADRPDDALAAVLRSVVLLEEILERLRYGLPERREVGATVTGVLSVDERGDVLAVGVAVRQHDLHVLSHQMDRLVERCLGDGVFDQVEKTVLGLVGDTVQDKCQPFLKVGVILDHGLHVVHVELEVPEHRAVRCEDHEGSVLLADFLFPVAAHQLSALVPRPGAFAVPEGLDVELLGQGVHGLRADAVQADGLLESLVVELASGVQLACCLDDGVERDASSKVPDGDLPVLDVDDDLLAESCGELVDTVIHDLLEQHIDAVSRIGAVAKSSDVHSRTPADVFDTFQGPYVVVSVVVVLFYVRHLS